MADLLALLAHGKDAHQVGHLVMLEQGKIASPAPRDDPFALGSLQGTADAANTHRVICQSTPESSV